MLPRLIGVALAMLVFAPPAVAGRNDSFPLTRGDHGPRVAGLQWMLSGKKPSAYAKTVKTFRYKPNGLYGARTAAAVKQAKWRLGFPNRVVNGTAGRDFWDILQGKRARPIMYVARTTRRLKASPTHSAIQVGGVSLRGYQILAAARSQLGLHRGTYEVWGWNWGPNVKRYQSITGAYRAPWCVSFVQWALVRAGYGTIANRSAGVCYVRDWARNRGWLRSQAKAARLVAFLDRACGPAHIGIVERVFPGGFVSLEGNAGDRVTRRTHYIGSRPMVFISLPGVS